MNSPDPLPSADAVALTVNGRATAIDMSPATRLSEALRDGAGLKGTKVGCDAGDCGACTVLLDGEPVCACMTALGQAAGRDVETVEALAADGALHRLQQSFLDHGAAQCGICTPGMLVSAAALLRNSPAPTEDQVMDALGGVLCRCTGYRKIVEAVMDAARPGDAGGAGPVGRRIVRIDGRPKVLGTDVFGDDAAPAEALVLRVIRSPHHAARFAFGDLDAFVASSPGVEAVFTAADIPGENRFGVIPPFAEQPVFAADGQVRFRGEAIAAVVGERSAIAALEAEAFPVAWTAEDPLMSPEAARRSDRPIHETRDGNVLVRGYVERGDVSAIDAAAHVAETRIETAFVEHAYIEPEAGFATVEDGRVVIHACTQAPHMDRAAVAAILNLPEDDVVVVPTAVGGGFGSKIDVSIQPLLALAALRLKRPVRITYTRPESMASTTKRHPASMHVRAGAGRDGRLVGLSFDGVFDTGAYASWGPTVANRVPVHASGPYLTPNYRAEAVAVHTNGPVAGAFRGFGVPQAAIAQETAFDRLADACGIDRLEFRILNALDNGDPTITGQRFAAGVGIRRCLEALREPWAAARERAANANEGGPVARRGVGLGTCWYGCGNTSLPNPSTIRAGIRADGRIRLHQGAVDIGQGANTVIAQIFAQALGVGVEAVELFTGDTSVTPDAGKTSASRQTFVSGNAALRAGRSLREALLRHANVSGEAEIVTDGHRIVVRENGVSHTPDLGFLPVDRDGFVLSVAETYDPPTTPLDEKGQGAPYAVYGYGAQLVELAVDTRLGTVRVENVVAAHDVGRAINPVLVEGQIEGGIAQGLGMALMEEYAPGVTENLHDYLIPTIGDMPPVTSIIIEEPDPEGPYGAKGLGEHVLIPTAPAILNAIRDATGAEVRKVPATPARVLAAIREAADD